MVFDSFQIFRVLQRIVFPLESQCYTGQASHFSCSHMPDTTDSPNRKAIYGVPESRSQRNSSAFRHISSIQQRMLPAFSRMFTCLSREQNSFHMRVRAEGGALCVSIWPEQSASLCSWSCFQRAVMLEYSHCHLLLGAYVPFAGLVITNHWLENLARTATQGRSPKMLSRQPTSVCAWGLAKRPKHGPKQGSRLPCYFFFLCSEKLVVNDCHTMMCYDCVDCSWVKGRGRMGRLP